MPRYQRGWGWFITLVPYSLTKCPSSAVNLSIPDTSLDGHRMELSNLSLEFGIDFYREYQGIRELHWRNYLALTTKSE
jgi:hypothetical protein